MNTKIISLLLLISLAWSCNDSESVPRDFKRIIRNNSGLDLTVSAYLDGLIEEQIILPHLKSDTAYARCTQNDDLGYSNCKVHWGSEGMDSVVVEFNDSKRLVYLNCDDQFNCVVNCETPSECLINNKNILTFKEGYTIVKGWWWTFEITEADYLLAQ